jgi:hypothetical protein
VRATITGDPEAVRLVTSAGNKPMAEVGPDTYETTIDVTATTQLVAQAKVNGKWKGSSGVNVTVAPCNTDGGSSSVPGVVP